MAANVAEVALPPERSADDRAREAQDGAREGDGAAVRRLRPGASELATHAQEPEQDESPMHVVAGAPHRGDEVADEGKRGRRRSPRRKPRCTSRGPSPVVSPCHRSNPRAR